MIDLSIYNFFTEEGRKKFIEEFKEGEYFKKSFYGSPAIITVYSNHNGFKIKYLGKSDDNVNNITVYDRHGLRVSSYYEE